MGRTTGACLSSRAQQENPELNIVTGFHLFDDEQHLFVLEGRKEEAIDLLYEAVPKTKGQSTVLINRGFASLIIAFG